MLVEKEEIASSRAEPSDLQSEPLLLTGLLLQYWVPTAGAHLRGHRPCRTCLVEYIGLRSYQSHAYGFPRKHGAFTLANTPMFGERPGI